MVRVFRRTYSRAGDRPCIYIPKDLERYLDWEPGASIELSPLDDEDGFKVTLADKEDDDDA